MNKNTKTKNTTSKRKQTIKPKVSDIASQQCSIKIEDPNHIKMECYNLASFKATPDGSVFYCIHCELAFYNDKTMKNHLGTVHSDFHYFCEYCGAFFSNDWQLKRHQNRYRYNCNQCEYSTNHYSQYREHSGRVHKIKMKPKFRSENRFCKVYECEFCGYQVIRPHMFKKHMKTIHDKDTEL